MRKEISEKELFETIPEGVKFSVSMGKNLL